MLTDHSSTPLWDLSEEQTLTSTIGIRLRELREKRDISQRQLARQLHCSHSLVSRWETGDRTPRPEEVRKCDEMLGANGALIKAQAGDTMMIGTPDPAEYQDLLDDFRSSGQQRPPRELYKSVKRYADELTTLAQDASGADRTALLSCGARFAEYCGWLAQEMDRDELAVDWTRKAADLAKAAGDRDLAAYTLVRQGLVWLYRNHAGETIRLAQQAQLDRRTTPRVRGLAALREAQGFGLAREKYDCEATFERGRALLVQDAPTGHVYGSRNVPDLVDAAQGWSWYDLGEPVRAATVLRGVVHQIPRRAFRARSRYGVRFLLALADSKEIDEVCGQAGSILRAARHIDSATVRLDLRRLIHVLGWHRQIEEVRYVCDQIGELLRPSSRPTGSR